MCMYMFWAMNLYKYSVLLLGYTIFFDAWNIDFVMWHARVRCTPEHFLSQMDVDDMYCMYIAIIRIFLYSYYMYIYSYHTYIRIYIATSWSECIL